MNDSKIFIETLISMDETEFLKMLDDIKEVDQNFLKEAVEYNDTLCKPLGSLGNLEEIYIRLFGIFKGKIPKFKKVVTVFASDNGVYNQNVSFNPQDTTYKVCQNIISEGSGLCRLAKFYNVSVRLQDLGVLKDVENHNKLKVGYSTDDITKGPAMSRESALKGLKAGFINTYELIQEGFNLFGAGEMGVANTTTSAAVISVLTDTSSETSTGYGSGITDEMYENKKNVIKRAIEVNSPFKDVIDVCAKLSGYDILGMAGTYLSCAYFGFPFVLDGVISMAALLIASGINPKVLDYAFSSHSSVESGAKVTQHKLKLKPFLNLNMRLGEGSGCPIAMSVIESAVFTLSTMASFKDVSLEKNNYIDIRKENNDEQNF